MSDRDESSLSPERHFDDSVWSEFMNFGDEPQFNTPAGPVADDDSRRTVVKENAAVQVDQQQPPSLNQHSSVNEDEASMPDAFAKPIDEAIFNQYQPDETVANKEIVEPRSFNNSSSIDNNEDDIPHLNALPSHPPLKDISRNLFGTANFVGNHESVQGFIHNPSFVENNQVNTHLRGGSMGATLQGGLLGTELMKELDEFLEASPGYQHPTMDGISHSTPASNVFTNDSLDQFPTAETMLKEESPQSPSYEDLLFSDGNEFNHFLSASTNVSLSQLSTAETMPSTESSQTQSYSSLPFSDENDYNTLPDMSTNVLLSQFPTAEAMESKETSQTSAFNSPLLPDTNPIHALAAKRSRSRSENSMDTDEDATRVPKQRRLNQQQKQQLHQPTQQLQETQEQRQKQTKLQYQKESQVDQRGMQMGMQQGRLYHPVNFLQDQMHTAAEDQQSQVSLFNNPQRRQVSSMARATQHQQLSPPQSSPTPSFNQRSSQISIEANKIQRYFPPQSSSLSRFNSQSIRPSTEADRHQQLSPSQRSPASRFNPKSSRPSFETEQHRRFYSLQSSPPSRFNPPSDQFSIEAERQPNFSPQSLPMSYVASEQRQQVSWPDSKSRRMDSTISAQRQQESRRTPQSSCVGSMPTALQQQAPPLNPQKSQVGIKKAETHRQQGIPPNSKMKQDAQQPKAFQANHLSNQTDMTGARPKELEVIQVVTLRVIRDSGIPYDIRIEKRLACLKSPKMNEALNSTPDGRAKVYRLINTTVNAALLLANWIGIENSEFPLPADRSFEPKDYLPSLMVLAVLAERLQMPYLRDQASSRFSKVSREQGGIPLHLLKYVWEHTESESTLRKTVTQLCANKLHVDEKSMNSEWFPKELVVDMLRETQSSSLNSGRVVPARRK
jgi:hypothetical protein